MRRSLMPLALLALASLLMGAWPSQDPAPRQTECVFTDDGNVPASCMYNTVITNRGAGKTIELELPVFKVGMEFCAVNDDGESFTLDPNTTDRFLSPATDTGGDYLISTVQGDVVCAMVRVANTARVISNTGGWNEE
jgi:hypothetical protein